MKKVIAYMAIFLLGIFFSLLFGSTYIGSTHVGGTNTYKAALSGDGNRLAVIDTRTGHVKIFDVQAEHEIEAFEKRILPGYQNLNRR